MTKTKSTKRSLIMSLLSLLICVTMLIGTTYAWFTDSVTSAGNIIKSGNLDVTMEWKDATATGAQQTYKDASAGPIFNYDLWEPGYVEAKNIKIGNAGTLALKYQLNIIATGEVSKLADVIDVYYAEGEYTLADRTMSELTKLGTLTDVLAAISTTASGDLLAGETDTVTLALKMQESAGNEYQNLAIGSEFAVQLLATQLTSEKDSFDNQYDKMATIDDEAELLEALAADYDLIQLGANITLTDSVVIPAGKTVAIDLAGYTMSQVNAQQTSAYAMIANKGNLTIKDSIGTGKISYTDTTPYTSDPNWASNTIRNEGTLTVNGGTVENLTPEEVTNYGYPHAIDAYQGSVTTINGGTVKSLNYDCIRMFCNSETLATTVNINGGTIVNRVSFQDPAANRAGYGVLNISGGNFVTMNGVTANVRLLNFSNVSSNMKATVTGGSFDKGFKTQDIVNAGVKTSDWLIMGTAVVATTAAELKTALDNAVDGTVIKLAANITGDVTVLKESNENVTIDGNGNKFTGVMTLTGNTDTGSLTIKKVNFVAAAGAKSAIVAPAKYDNGNKNNYVKNVVIDGCTFTDPDNDLDCAAVRASSGGKQYWTIKNCVVESSMHSFVQADNIEKSLVIEGCKVYSKNGANLGQGAVLAMTGCTFDVTGYAVRFGVNGTTVNGTFQIKDSTLKSANDDGDAVIIFRGTMTGSTLTITNTTLIGNPEITGEANVVRN